MDQFKFSSIAISDELKRGISDMGYSEATSIQSESIPLILKGYDVIGKSQTGSGKTAAFGLPAIEAVDEELDPNTVQVLILCPTRELAVQACNEIKKFSKYKNEINAVPIYGGESIIRQITRLKQGCQIVVGTPGRIMDHMRRKTLKFADVKMVVLDEADEMLNMGFIEDIETILNKTPDERQTVLFSATMPPAVLEITKKFQRDPKMVEIKKAQLTVSTIEQYYFKVPRGNKNTALFRLLEYYKPKSSIIFCNTKKMVDELIEELKNHGFPALGLHGDMRQGSRTQAMKQFKENKLGILVATDIAARGIDVDDIKIVINYDLPQEDEYYVHRIGRTVRAGRTGMAFSLVQSGKQLSQLMNIMRYTKSEISQKPLPTLDEIIALKIKDLSDDVLSYMETTDISTYKSAIEKLTDETYSLEDIAAALFAMSMNSTLVNAESDTELDDASFTDYDSDEKPNKSRRLSEKQKQPRVKNPQYNDENMVSVRISIGRRDKISPNHILGTVAGETGLPGKIFGAINIQNSFTTIDVPKEYRTLVVKSLNNSKIKGINIKAN